MSIITVADILELNVLKNARIVAGKRGLNREVNSVNVYRQSIQAPQILRSAS